MSWDNRIFNVNGRGLDMLTAALTLVANSGEKTRGDGQPWDMGHTKFSGSLVDPDHGLIWLWGDCKRPGCVMYPADLTPRQAAEISLAWLETDAAKAMKCEDWDEDADHDGSNSRGWRVYVEDWGHVGPAEDWAICAVRPAYLWHGK